MRAVNGTRREVSGWCPFATRAATTDEEYFEALTAAVLECRVSAEVLRTRWRSFRAAFAGFDPEKVARFDETDRARLMADPGIIRSNGKIDAAIAGARIYLDMRESGEDFSQFLWDMVGGAPIQNYWQAGQVPAQTPLAVEMSKALKAKGFKFCGPVIVYAFMQATGLVNDHLVTCYRHAECRAMARER